MDDDEQTVMELIVQSGGNLDELKRLTKDVLGKISIVSNDKTKNVKVSINNGNINLEITLPQKEYAAYYLGTYDIKTKEELHALFLRAEADSFRL